MTPTKSDTFYANWNIFHNSSYVEKPKGMGGTEEYNNLIIVHEFVHKLIHATNEETIRTYMRILQVNDKQLTKINKLRKSCSLVTLV
ncbi:hypothetical protein FORC13_p070 (plasmid) [Bacillus cereus]|nr:hypothetical protein FORC13_p070 [Bacillus cereus]